jgi:hypothetical protein
MKVSQRIIPLEKVKQYNGTKQDGTAYRIDTWKVRCVISSNDIILTCFDKVGDYLDKKRNLEVDGEIVVKLKQYNGNYYNDLQFVNPVYDEDANDVPSDSKEGYKANAVPDAVSTVSDEDNGLPF